MSLPLDDMVIGDHRVTMKKGVAEIKARLSEYLRMVRKGREITIYDRDQPIARLVPYAPRSTLAVREPIASYRTLADIPLPPPVNLTVDSVAVLMEDRRADR